MKCFVDSSRSELVISHFPMLIMSSYFVKSSIITHGQLLLINIIYNKFSNLRMDTLNSITNTESASRIVR